MAWQFHCWVFIPWIRLQIDTKSCAYRGVLPASLNVETQASGQIPSTSCTEVLRRAHSSQGIGSTGRPRVRKQSGGPCAAFTCARVRLTHVPEDAEYLRTQRNDGCLGEGTELLDNGVAPCGTSRILYHAHLLVKIILRISKKKPKSNTVHSA